MCVDQLSVQSIQTPNNFSNGTVSIWDWLMVILRWSGSLDILLDDVTIIALVFFFIQNHFIFNIPDSVISAKIKWPKNTHGMVTFWIKKRKNDQYLSSEADPASENWIWSYPYFNWKDTSCQFKTKWRSFLECLRI